MLFLTKLSRLIYATYSNWTTDQLLYLTKISYKWTPKWDRFHFSKYLKNLDFKGDDSFSSYGHFFYYRKVKFKLRNGWSGE